MRIRKFSALAIICAIASVTTFAAADDGSSGQSAVNVDDLKDKNTVYSPSGEDADDILTNNKLRAESGSKSRVSVATSMVYNGGTVGHPFGDTRPNIQDATGSTDVTDIEGGINMKINLTPLDSILLGGTVRWITPFSHISQVPNGYAGEKFDMYDPQLNYQRIYKVGNLQSYVQVGPGWVTRTNLTAIGYLGNFGVYNVNAYDIGTTRFTVGLETGVQYNWFKTPQAYPQYGMSEEDVRADEADWQAFAFPYLEYKVNDRVSLRTVMMFFSMEHTLDAQSMRFADWHKDTAMQSVGVGISLTRDAFLYPNVQFVPDRLRPSETNFGIATNINMF